MTEPCCGCGGRFAPISGPTHAYMLSSAACWVAYGAVLAVEYADPGLFSHAHRLTVDAYALQHPGRADEPRAARSVWLHFASLRAVLTLGRSHHEARQLLQAFAGHDFGPLPPTPAFDITLADIAPIAQGDHVAAVSRWAKGALEAWRPLLEHRIAALAF